MSAMDLTGQTPTKIMSAPATSGSSTLLGSTIRPFLPGLVNVSNTVSEGQSIHRENSAAGSPSCDRPNQKVPTPQPQYIFAPLNFAHTNPAPVNHDSGVPSQHAHASGGGQMLNSVQRMPAHAASQLHRLQQIGSLKNNSQQPSPSGPAADYHHLRLLPSQQQPYDMNIQSLQRRPSSSTHPASSVSPNHLDMNSVPFLQQVQTHSHQYQGHLQPPSMPPASGQSSGHAQSARSASSSQHDSLGAQVHPRRPSSQQLQQKQAELSVQGSSDHAHFEPSAHPSQVDDRPRLQYVASVLAPAQALLENAWSQAVQIVHRDMTAMYQNFRQTLQEQHKQLVNSTNQSQQLRIQLANIQAGNAQLQGEVQRAKSNNDVDTLLQENARLKEEINSLAGQLRESQAKENNLVVQNRIVRETLDVYSTAAQKLQSPNEILHRDVVNTGVEEGAGQQKSEVIDAAKAEFTRELEIRMAPVLRDAREQREKRLLAEKKLAYTAQQLDIMTKIVNANATSPLISQPTLPFLSGINEGAASTSTPTISTVVIKQEEMQLPVSPPESVISFHAQGPSSLPNEVIDLTDDDVPSTLSADIPLLPYPVPLSRQRSPSAESERPKKKRRISESGKENVTESSEEETNEGEYAEVRCGGNNSLNNTVPEEILPDSVKDGDIKSGETEEFTTSSDPAKQEPEKGEFLQEAEGSVGDKKPSLDVEPASVTQTTTTIVPPGIRNKIGINHIYLLYETTKEKMICRMCITRRDKAGATAPPASFPLTASWLELMGHCRDEHPAACVELEKYSSSQVAELRQRMMSRHIHAQARRP